ncbi:L-threonylcarbamoyladenylate synthase [Urechidicola sp. KH5]
MSREFQKEIANSLAILESNKVLVYPTDTVWGIGCDATSEEAVQEIYNIKKRPDSKSLILLVSSVEMLQRYVTVPQNVISFLEESKEPTTVIYNNPKGIAPSCIAKDETVAIRIAYTEYCQELINTFGKAIVSTSANISGQPTAKSFQEIEPAILESVDYVVNLPHHKSTSKPSRIVRVLTDGTIEILRA